MSFSSQNSFNSNKDYSIGFGPVNINKYYSFFGSDNMTEVIDVYMNYYE